MYYNLLVNWLGTKFRCTHFMFDSNQMFCMGTNETYTNCSKVVIQEAVSVICHHWMRKKLVLRLAGSGTNSCFLIFMIFLLFCDFPALPKLHLCYLCSFVMLYIFTHLKTESYSDHETPWNYFFIHWSKCP